jgi:hypothetical protein
MIPDTDVYSVCYDLCLAVEQMRMADDLGGSTAADAHTCRVTEILAQLVNEDPHRALVVAIVALGRLTVHEPGRLIEAFELDGPHLASCIAEDA